MEVGKEGDYIAIATLSPPEFGWLVLRENGARLTPTETVRLIRDGEKVWGGRVEVGKEGDYIAIATLSPPEFGWLVLRENGARLTPTETVRLIRDGEKVWGGRVEVGKEGDYIAIATLSPPEFGWLVLRENGARLTPTETVRLIRDGEKVGKGVWRGRGRLYSYRYTVTTRIWLAGTP